MPCEGGAVPDGREVSMGPAVLVLGYRVVLDVPSTRMVVVRLFPVARAVCPTVEDELLLTSMVWSHATVVLGSVDVVVAVGSMMFGAPPGVTSEPAGELSVTPLDIQHMAEVDSMVQGLRDRGPPGTDQIEGTYGGSAAFSLMGVSRDAHETSLQTRTLHGFPHALVDSLHALSIYLAGSRMQHTMIGFR